MINGFKYVQNCTKLNHGSFFPSRNLTYTSRLFAGHSKWQNIRHDKAKNDAKKSREANSLALRIESSVRTGGAESNAQLVTLIDKAKKLNVTKKIIDNAIKRGLGENVGDKITHSVTYEFMGPGGVAIVIEAQTDNKSRTIGNVKHALSKFNASLSPCLYLFERKGLIIFESSEEYNDLDTLLELAIDVGAEDVEEFIDHENEYKEENLFQITTDPGDINRISNELSQKGLKLKDTNVNYIAEGDNEVDFPEEYEKSFSKALEMLDELPEITDYYTNIKD
ncbi:probable transcriptional regulatory protein HAH1 [[Candida] jaroonii]|uniref:Probable transcriptional regulatory protein HAH1 n=1 Tax=[Candida] jaroonii TaxID=467808 RepID=A0ACA9YDS0_9ASCO|nr:probable transcriptional regulatory protein HAH1 [[Candida] jaroonii]